MLEIRLSQSKRKLRPILVYLKNNLQISSWSNFKRRPNKKNKNNNKNKMISDMRPVPDPKKTSGTFYLTFTRPIDPHSFTSNTFTCVVEAAAV